MISKNQINVPFHTTPNIIVSLPGLDFRNEPETFKYIDDIIKSSLSVAKIQFAQSEFARFAAT